MRRLTSIVAVNRDGVIGCRNSLPWRIKRDMAFFRDTTSHNVVIMGRKTHDSLGRCLPNRYNIVVSTKRELMLDTDSCVVRHGINEALAESELAPSVYAETFVIGGATMYEQYAPFVDRYLITLVDFPVSGGDAFFDLNIFSDPGTWESRRLPILPAEGDASFEVFEFTANDRLDRERRRADMLKSLTPARERRPIPKRAVKPVQPVFAFLGN